MNIDSLSGELKSLIESPIAATLTGIAETLDSFSPIGSPYSGIKTLLSLKDVPSLIYWSKLQKFLYGIDSIDSDNRKIFIEKLDKIYDSSRFDFGYRLLEIIEKLDIVYKAEIFANLTKSLIRAEIDLNLYFRLAHALCNVFWEDLLWLNDNIIHTNLKEDIYSTSLLQHGLTYQSVLDGGGVDGESDNRYEFTNLARQLYKWAFNGAIPIEFDAQNEQRKVDVSSIAKWG